MARYHYRIAWASFHIVPTAIARKGNTFHVGNLGVFPIEPGTQQFCTG
jgi:hypothetical protein